MCNCHYWLTTTMIFSPPFEQSVLLLAVAVAVAPVVVRSQQHCGQLRLTVHKQKWFVPSVQTVAAHKTTDLNECLEHCCKLQECDAVSFIGFLSAADGKKQENTNDSTNSSIHLANCLLFNCGDSQCPVVSKPLAKEGVVSVQIQRKAVSSPPPLPFSTPILPPLNLPSEPMKSNASENDASTSQSSKIAHNQGAKNSTNLTHNSKEIEHLSSSSVLKPKENIALAGELKDHNKIAAREKGNEKNATEHEKTLETMSSSSSSTSQDQQQPNSFVNLSSWNETFPLNAEEIPVWVVGVIIIVSIVCVALALTTVAMYICYTRHRRQMRTINISNTLKPLPTLHAFNPTT